LTVRQIPEDRKRKYGKGLRQQRTDLIFNLWQIRLYYKEKEKIGQTRQWKSGGPRFGMMGGAVRLLQDVKEVGILVKNAFLEKIVLVDEWICQNEWNLEESQNRFGNKPP